METTSEGEAAGEIIKEQQHLPALPATVTVDEKNNMKIKKVMVAVDDSKESAYALKWALDNLFPKQQLKQEEEEEESGVVTLVLVHVYQPYQPFVFPAAPGLRIITTNYATTAMIESARKSQAQNSARVVSRALELCKSRPVITETVVLVGDQKDAICQATETTDCDLLVVGSRVSRTNFFNRSVWRLNTFSEFKPAFRLQVFEVLASTRPVLQQEEEEYQEHSRRILKNTMFGHSSAVSATIVHIMYNAPYLL